MKTNRLKQLANECYFQSIQYKNEDYLRAINQLYLAQLIDPELCQQLDIAIQSDRFCLARLDHHGHDIFISRHPFPGLYAIGCRFKNSPGLVQPTISPPLRADEVQKTLLTTLKNLDRPFEIEALIDRTANDRPF